MRWQVVRRFLGLAAVLVAGAALCPGPAAAHEKEDEKKPDPPVKLSLVAPSATGPWLMRVDNVGDHPTRIAADVRLLSFKVKKPATKKGKRRLRARTDTCDGPKAFGLESIFPADRQLVLKPGESYVEQFDPRLICFGKQAELLVPGAKVSATLGWKPNKRWHAMSSAPFAVDDAAKPRKFRPLRRLTAEDITLDDTPPPVYGSDVKGRSAGADPADSKAKATDGKAADGKAADGKGDGNAADGKGDGNAATGKGGGRSRRGKRGGKGPRFGEPKPDPDKPTPDALGARLTLTASGYAEGRRPTDIAVSVQAHNSGERPLFMAVRSRMLSFVVEGPNGPIKCGQPDTDHKVPRDLFRMLHHGKHVHMNVLLAEVCPPGTFDRPGLYVATPTLHAHAAGAEYGLTAVTGTVTTRDRGKVGGTHSERDDATLIRVKDGRKRFYSRPPQALPTRVLPPANKD